MPSVRWTRRSFAYLIGYLALGGAAMLIAPDVSFRLLGAARDYPLPMIRLVGAFLIALAVIVIQIARLRIEALYATTLVVRLPIVCVTIGLYIASRDPVFLSLAAIVGLGMALTSAGVLLDRLERLRPGVPSSDASERR